MTEQTKTTKGTKMDTETRARELFDEISILTTSYIELKDGFPTGSIVKRAGTLALIRQALSTEES